MPAAPPITYPTLSNGLSSRPYILQIRPAGPASDHLILRHPSPTLTVADGQTLQPVEQLQGGHTGDVTDVYVEQGEGAGSTAIYSSAKDATVVRWDERSRRPALTIKAVVRRPIPVLSVTASERDHLVIAGTELASSEAHIIFWDTRNTKQAAYTHSSTHSDDITHLSLLPSTSAFLPPTGSTAAGGPIPDRLLLSTSTDGLVALSDVKETDEDEAVVAEENWGVSIADAGAYAHNGRAKVWARSDMDQVAVWDITRNDQDGELELQNVLDLPTEQFKFRDYTLPSSAAHTVQTAAEAHDAKASNRLKSDYLIDVVPSLGLSSRGGPITAVGSNGGDMVLQHHQAGPSGYAPSGYFLTVPQPPSRGHKDVVRALYHSERNEALYTGSEDGVLCGWNLASLSDRLRVGDPVIDDDGGDGREDVASDDDQDEESEIETEEDDDDDNDDDSDGMDVDGDGYGFASSGVRRREPGPVLGRGTAVDDRREKRKQKRQQPY